MGNLDENIFPTPHRSSQHRLLRSVRLSGGVGVGIDYCWKKIVGRATWGECILGCGVR